MIELASSRNSEEKRYAVPITVEILYILLHHNIIKYKPLLLNSYSDKKIEKTNNDNTTNTRAFPKELQYSRQGQIGSTDNTGRDRTNVTDGF